MFAGPVVPTVAEIHMPPWPSETTGPLDRSPVSSASTRHDLPFQRTTVMPGLPNSPPQHGAGKPASASRLDGPSPRILVLGIAFPPCGARTLVGSRSVRQVLPFQCMATQITGRG